MIGRACLGLAVALVGCGPGAAGPSTPPPPGGALRDAAQGLELSRLTGPWRWLHAEQHDGTLRLERERWRWERETVAADTGAREVRGRYRRDVLVVALDGKAFVCNQLTSYLQTSSFAIRARRDDDGVGVVIDELDYQVAPSPCEPGFRRLGSYRAEVDRDTATLRWADGEQQLTRLPDGAFDDAELALPAPPASPAAGFTGAWHWRILGQGGELEVREEDEAWQLAVGDDGVAGGTYRRVVTVRRPDGAAIACAGAASYSYVDLYTLRGKLADDVLTLEEVAVEPGQHPCLDTTPTRHLDAFTATAHGAYLVLTWRGPRQQVLHRH